MQHPNTIHAIYVDLYGWAVVRRPWLAVLRQACKRALSSLRNGFSSPQEAQKVCCRAQLCTNPPCSSKGGKHRRHGNGQDLGTCSIGWAMVSAKFRTLLRMQGPQALLKFQHRALSTQMSQMQKKLHKLERECSRERKRATTAEETLSSSHEMWTVVCRSSQPDPLFPVTFHIYCS